MLHGGSDADALVGGGVWAHRIGVRISRTAPRGLYRITAALVDDSGDALATYRGRQVRVTDPR